MARALPARLDTPRLAAALLGLLMLCAGADLAAQTREPATAAACSPAVQSSDPQCVASARKSDESVAPLMAASYWFRPLGAPGPREPAAGSLLATICLAWLVLLAVATVVRPRGWRHRPLFGGLRRGAGGRA
jgi:hypothetical protein